MIPFGRQKKSVMLVLCLLFMAVTATNPKLLPIILHFDINKSAAMVDPGQGKGVKEIINAAMAEAAYCPRGHDWASSEYDEERGCKYPVYDKSELPGKRANKAEAYYGSYQGYLKRKVEAKEMDKKKGMNPLIQTFTEGGHPGAPLFDRFQDLEAAMELPVNAASDAKAAANAGAEAEDKEAADDAEAAEQEIEYSDKYYTLLPSFFKLLYQVAVVEERDVSLIFRTFGADAPDIVEDLNKFCRGDHPVFHQEGFKHMLQNEKFKEIMKQFIVEPTDKQYAVSVRSAEKEGYTEAMVFGLDQKLYSEYDGVKPGRCKREDKMACMTEKEIIERVEASESQEGGRLVTGYTDIYNEITEMFKVPNMPKTAVIRSSHSYWNGNGEVAHAGKMFVVNPDEVLQVFFDDGVQKMLEDTKIIDCRYPDGNGISFEEGSDKYFARVEPMEAIGDVNYYVNKFNAMRKAQGDQIIYRARLTQIFTREVRLVRGNEWTRTTTFSPYTGKGLITFGGRGLKRKLRLTNETFMKGDAITVEGKDVSIITIAGLKEGKRTENAEISFVTPTEQSALDLINAIGIRCDELRRKASQANNN